MSTALAEKEEGTLRKVLRFLLTRYSLVMLWIVMIVVLMLVIPSGIDPIVALRAVLGQMTPIIFLGLAVVITMAVGEFDLSFAAIFGFSAVAVPALNVLYGWPIEIAIVAGFVLALIWGLVNGLLLSLIHI
jgi:ribose transport system permease protein